MTIRPSIKWHPHVITSVEKQPGGDYGVQYAVAFEDGEQHTYQLQELIHFAQMDREHLLDVFVETGRQDALAEYAALTRYYDEAERATVQQTHLGRYQQRLEQSVVESDQVYYQAYIEAFRSALN